MRYLFGVLAGYGYVYPAIGIAQALEKQGHEVAFATGRRFATVIENAGLTYIPYKDDYESFQVSDWGTGAGVMLQVRHLEHVREQFMPDVLVGSALTISVPLIASWHGLPCATIGLGTYVWPERNADPNPVFDSMPYVAQIRYAETLRLCTALNKYFGKPMLLGDVDSPTSLLGDLHLLRSCEALYPNLNALPSQVHFVGDCLWHPEDSGVDAELAAFLQRNRPKLYVQHDNRWSKPFYQDDVLMSGIPDFWTHLVTRFANSEYDLIVATGDKEIAAKPWADNIFVRSHVPHHQVLPFAKAVIATGTSSIMLSALTHGLPLLLVTTGSEAYNVAELCVNANVAVATEAHFVTQKRFDTVAESLLTTEHYFEQAMDVRANFAAYDGASRAAQQLAQLGTVGQKLAREATYAMA